MIQAKDCFAKDLSLILAFTILLVACGKAPDSRQPANVSGQLESGELDAPEQRSSDPVVDSLAAPEPFSLRTAVPAEYSGPATVWSHLATADAWDAATLAVVQANLTNFEKAHDRESFCPGYSSATNSQRLTCWVRLVSAVVKFESNFNQNSVYDEPSGGKDSVGLLMLSVGECPNAPTVAKLKIGTENLKCGTARMARLIARDGYVTSPNNVKGAAAYWSVLRNPYSAYGLKLGKRPQIVAITRTYRTIEPMVASTFD